MARSSDAVFPLSLLRDRSFQLQQIRRLLWLTLFFVVQSTLLLGFLYHQLLGDLVTGTAPLLFAAEELAALDQQVPATGDVMLRWLLLVLGMNALSMLCIGVYLMRKLGNPLLAMRRALDEIAAGNLNVRLRAGDADEFSELTVSLNDALEQVQQKIEAVREETRILNAAPPGEQRRPTAADIEQALSNCRNVLSFFREPAERSGPQRDGTSGSAADF